MWRVANSLDVLLDEINRAAPNRSKVSDGSIGDAAHASRDSDHNPWRIVNGIGVVGARDFTHDPPGGLDCAVLAANLVELYRAGHPALGSGAYTIWQRRIISRDRFGEGWRPYTGSNPHDHHLHQSVATAAAGFDSNAPWGVMEGADVALDKDEVQRIARAVWNQELLAGEDQVRAGRLLVQTHNRADVGARLGRIVEGLDQLEAGQRDDANRDQVRKLRDVVRELRQDLAEHDAGHGEVE